MKAHKIRNAIFIAVILSLSFAFMGVWIRMMQGSFDVFQQTYLRVLLAGLIALVVFRKKFSKNLLRSISRREWGIYIVRAFVAYTIGVAGFTIAIENTTLGTVAFVSSLPLLGLLAWVFFREKLPPKTLIPIAISIVGLALLTNVNFAHFSFGMGEIAAIICMLGFDIGYLMSRMHKKERSNYENTTIILLIGWIPIFLISLFRNESIIPQHVTALGITGLLLSSVANVFGLFGINYVFTNLKAYVAGNLLLLEGVFALIIGLFLYGEPITIGIAIGGILIIAASIAINNMEKKTEEVPTELLD